MRVFGSLFDALDRAVGLGGASIWRVLASVRTFLVEKSTNFDTSLQLPRTADQERSEAENARFWRTASYREEKHESCRIFERSPSRIFGKCVFLQALLTR